MSKVRDFALSLVLAPKASLSSVRNHINLTNDIHGTLLFYRLIKYKLFCVGINHETRKRTMREEEEI